MNCMHKSLFDRFVQTSFLCGQKEALEAITIDW